LRMICGSSLEYIRVRRKRVRSSTVGRFWNLRNRLVQIFTRPPGDTQRRWSSLQCHLGVRPSSHSPFPNNSARDRICSVKDVNESRRSIVLYHCPYLSPLNSMFTLPVLISRPALTAPLRKTRMINIQPRKAQSSSRSR